jgi:hypothetical protein
VLARIQNRTSQKALRTRKHARELLVFRARDAQGARERLEDRFDLMVARAPVHHLDVHVGSGAQRKAVEELVDELGLEIADLCHADLEIDDGVRASAEIDAATASVSSIGMTK